MTKQNTDYQHLEDFNDFKYERREGENAKRMRKHWLKNKAGIFSRRIIFKAIKK